MGLDEQQTAMFKKMGLKPVPQYENWVYTILWLWLWLAAISPVVCLPITIAIGIYGLSPWLYLVWLSLIGLLFADTFW